MEDEEMCVVFGERLSTELMSGEQGEELLDLFRHATTSLIFNRASFASTSKFVRGSEESTLMEIDAFFTFLISNASRIGSSGSKGAQEALGMLAMLKQMLTIVPDDFMLDEDQWEISSNLRLRLYLTVLKCLEALKFNDDFTFVSTTPEKLSLLDVIFLNDDVRRDFRLIEDTQRRQCARANSSSSSLSNVIDREERLLLMLMLQQALRLFQLRFDALIKDEVKPSQIVVESDVFATRKQEESVEELVWRHLLRKMNETGTFWQVLDLILGPIGAEDSAKSTKKRITIKPKLYLGECVTEDLVYWWLLKRLVSYEEIIAQPSAKAYDKIAKRLKQHLVAAERAKNEMDLCALIHVLAVVNRQLGFSKTLLSLLTDFFFRQLYDTKFFREPLLFHLPRSIKDLQAGLNETQRLSRKLECEYVKSSDLLDNSFETFIAFLRLALSNKQGNGTVTALKASLDRLCSTMRVDQLNNFRLHRSFRLLLTLLEAALGLNVDTKAISDTMRKIVGVILIDKHFTDSVCLLTNALALSILMTMEEEKEEECERFIDLFVQCVFDLTPSREKNKSKNLFVQCYQSYCDLFDHAWTKAKSKDKIVEQSQLFASGPISEALLYLWKNTRQYSGPLRKLIKVFVGIITRLRRRLGTLRAFCRDNLTVEKNQQLLMLEKSERQLLAVADRVMKEMAVFNEQNDCNNTIGTTAIAHFISAFFALKIDHETHKRNVKNGQFPLSTQNSFPPPLMGTLVFILTSPKVSHGVSGYFLRDLIEKNDMTVDGDSLFRKILVKGWLRYLIIASLEDRNSESVLDDYDGESLCPEELLRSLTKGVSLIPEMSLLRDDLQKELKYSEAFELLQSFFTAMGSLADTCSNSVELEERRKLFHPLIGVFIENLEHHQHDKKESRLIRWHQLSGLLFKKCLWLLYREGSFLENLASKLLRLTTHSSDLVAQKCFMLTERELCILAYSLPHYITALASLENSFARATLRSLIKIYFNRFPVNASHPFIPIMVDEKCSDKVKRQVLVMLKEENLMASHSTIEPMLKFGLHLLVNSPSSSLVSLLTEVLLEALLNARVGLNEQSYLSSILDECLTQLFLHKKTIREDSLDTIFDKQLASFVRNNVKFRFQAMESILKHIETLDEDCTSKLKLMSELNEAYAQRGLNLVNTELQSTRSKRVRLI